MAAARPHHSLSRALTRALLPWIAMLWVTAAGAVGWYLQHELSEQLDAGLVESAERLLDLAAHDARNHRNPSERDGTLYRLEVPHSNLSGAHHDVLMYQVVNGHNELLLRSADAPLTPLAVPLSTGFFDTPVLRTYTLAHPSLPMFIHVGDPLAHRSAARTQVLLGLLVPLLVILPLLGLLIRAVTQRALAPAGTLAAELQLRVGQAGEQVVGAVHNGLQLVGQALAANAAHELRTPLAAVRLNLQTALVHVPTGAAYTDIQGALQSLDRLSRRCEKLLQLSRAGSGAALAQDRVNLAQVAAAVAQEFWADAALLQRLQLVLPEDDDVWVRGDFDALAIALRNLVENAVRYAPQGPIVLEVALPATCSVRDSGPGLTTEQLGLLQQRHYREGHTASALYTPGYGLGLSIVTTIVARQGGTCTLHSPPPGHGTGLQVDLHLRADR